MLSRVSQKSMAAVLSNSARTYMRCAVRGAPASYAPRTAVASVSYSNSTFLRTNGRRWASTSVPVPPMAESLTEGSLKEYTKAVGEYIGQDELLATIETDKIDIEVNSPVAGTITKLNFQPDDTVTVGEELA